MGQPDNETAYGRDQDREPPREPGDARQGVDQNPGDRDADGDENPATGERYGEVDSHPR